MEEKKKRDNGVLLALFLLFLCVNFIIAGMVLSGILSRPVRVILLAAAAGLDVLMVRQVGISIRKRDQEAFQSLPPSFRRSVAGLTTREQISALCSKYNAEQAELNEIRVDRLLQRLISDNSHTEVISNLNRHLKEILHSDVFGYEWDQYCLVYTEFEDFESYLLKISGSSLMFDGYRKMNVTLKQAFYNALSRDCIVQDTECKNGCVFLVNLKNSAVDTPREELDKQLDAVCETCRETIREISATFNITVEAAVSDCFENPTDIHRNFDWLRKALQYNDFVGAQELVVDFRSIQRQLDAQREENADIMALQKNWYDAVLAENYDYAEHLLIDLLRLYMAEGISRNTLRERTNAYFSVVENISSNSGSGDQGSSLEWRRRIDSCQTQEELEHTIHEFFRDFSDCSQKRESELSETAQNITKYIGAHYTDPELSVAGIADSLSLSQTYISRIFSKEIGQSIPNYIHKIRLSKARDLMRKTDLPLAQIAEKVGYSTTWTMNHAFKNAFGITPGSWRKSMQQQDAVSDGENA